LNGIIARRKERDANWHPPASVRMLEWMFLRDSRTRDVFASIALQLFGVKKERGASAGDRP